MINIEKRREANRERNRRYRERNRENVKARLAQYYAEHHDDLRAKQTTYRNIEANKKKQSEYIKQYYKDNHDRLLERKKSYYQERRDEILAYQKEHRPIWHDEVRYKNKLVALERDNWQCQDCGAKLKRGFQNLAVHHLDYTDNEPNNLISLCVSCHAKRHLIGNCFSSEPVPK